MFVRHYLLEIRGNSKASDFCLRFWAGFLPVY